MRGLRIDRRICKQCVMFSAEITVLTAAEWFGGYVRGKTCKGGPLARRFYGDKEGLNFVHRFPVFVRFMMKILLDFRCRTQLRTTTGRQYTTITRRAG